MNSRTYIAFPVNSNISQEQLTELKNALAASGQISKYALESDIPPELRSYVLLVAWVELLASEYGEDGIQGFEEKVTGSIKGLNFNGIRLRELAGEVEKAIIDAVGERHVQIETTLQNPNMRNIRRVSWPDG